jgi:hypothetical protein
VAAERERRDPRLVSRWQLAMRRASRYEDLVSQAAAEPGMEFTDGGSGTRA